MGFEDVQIKIPISVIIVTKNEGLELERCLKPLEEFAEIWLVNSGSNKQIEQLAEKYEAHYLAFSWNGQYPKKRQWCLDNLELSCDWVLFIDADEVLTRPLLKEIKRLDYHKAGYFMKGAYVWQGRVLKYGLQNNKLALFDRRKIEFPVIDDLGFKGMGEIEGHYQPVLKDEFKHEQIGHLKSPLLHYAYDDPDAWEERHRRYACWAASMDQHKAWPNEPTFIRKALKACFQAMPCKPLCAFLHSYLLKRGFMDGADGYAFALSRARYYRMIARASKDGGASAENSKARTALQR